MKTFYAVPRKWGMLLAAALMFGSQAQAVEWPQNPVIGVIGSSFADCDAPIDSPLLGIGFVGCSYEGLATKLLKNHTLNTLGITVQTAALGGASSYDVPNTGWLGYMSQYGILVNRTFWFDGPRMKYLVVGLVKDCLFGQLCTEQDIRDTLIANTMEVITAARAAGITVIVNGYPLWESLDLPLAAQNLGITETPTDAATYNLMKHIHEQSFTGLDGVIYNKAWEHMFITIDGLHPNNHSQINAAEAITQAITP